MKPNSPENIRALEAMSTENLEALLRAEMESDREVNVELIDAVCAVLDERTESEPVDVDAAWNSFLHNHLTTEPLYSTPKEAPKKKVIHKKRWKRLGIAAALLATYLLGATMSANAVGYTLMDTVVIWTSETFGFSFDQSSNTSSIVTNPEYTELKTALALADITSPLCPNYLPDGFKQTEIYSEDNRYVGIYQQEDHTIIIQIQKIIDINNVQHEKGDIPPETYNVDTIDHYISGNIDTYKAVWANDEYECSISGVPTKEELCKMIDSIYVEE